MSTCLRKIPIAQPDPGRGGGRGRPPGDPLGLGHAGAGGRGLRGGVRGLRRRSPRLRRLELHDGAAPGPARPRRRAGRRGHHGQPLVHRHGQRRPLLRGPAGVRRHRPADLQHRPRPDRSGDHPADPGDHARAPDRPALRHGGHPRRSPGGTACRWSRTRPAPSAARCASGERWERIGRPHGDRRLLLVPPPQGDHHRRRGHAHHPRPRAGPPVPPAPPARHEHLRHRPARGQDRSSSRTIRSSASTTG